MASAKRGRPSTGRTTAVMAFRVTLAQAVEIRRRAAGVGRSVSEWLEMVVGQEIKPRPGQGTRARFRQVR